MVNVHTERDSRIFVDRRRDFCTYRNDCHLQLLFYHKLVCVSFILTLLAQQSIYIYSIYLLINTSHLRVCYPTRRVLAGLKSEENVIFSLKCIFCLILCNVWILSMAVLLSGDVHPNPGPQSDASTTTNTSNYSFVKDQLCLVHVNIQSMLTKLDILEVEMQYYDIVVLTETWLSASVKDADIIIPNFDPPYRKDREGRLGGGVAIYLRSGLFSHKRMNLFHNDLEALCIEVTSKHHKFLISGYYRPPNTGIEYWDLIEQSFENLANSTIKDIIILGDFNCNMMNNTPHNRINILSLSYNLTQLIDEPTHFTEHSSSLIDLALVTRPENVLYSGVISPFIPDVVRFHCPIILTLKFRKPAISSFKRHIWLYDQGNYDLYRDKLNQINWELSFFSNDINIITEDITEKIISAATECIPNKTVTIRPNEPEWLNAYIKRHIRQRKRLFKTAKRSNDIHAWTRFKTKRNMVTTLLRQSKKRYFDKLASDLQNNSLSSKSWFKISNKFLRNVSNQSPIPVLETTNDIFESDREKAELLNTFFVQQSTIDDTNASLPECSLPSHELLTDINITRVETIKAIKLMAVNKASGPDSISPKLIKEGINQLADPLTKLFNLSLLHKIFPNAWKRSNVTAIHKKDSRNNPTNYRPISLLNILGKLMERCIHYHLYNYFTLNDIITPFQSGFRKGDSTVNQLLYLYNDFSKSLDNNKEIRVVFCDISKAFDKVWHRGLLFKLRQAGLSGNIIDWFADYLSNRWQRVCVRGHCSSWKQISAGVPQGSILGPILFLIYINDIVQDVCSNIRLFADDTSLYVIVEDPIHAANLLNHDLKLIHGWAKQWLVDFHPEKTESLIISKRKNKPHHPPLHMGNTNIKEVDSHKHLGLTFSNDGSWNSHINIITEKAWKRIGSLRKNKFILDRRSLSKIYVTFIRPLLEYGNIIWTNCTLECKRLLEKVQLEAARIVTGATKLSSIQKLYSDTGWDTLQSRQTKHKSIQLYKMINGLTPRYLQNLVPFRVHEISRYPLRNVNNFTVPMSRTVSHSNSFLPSALRDWNEIDPIIRNSSTITLFKSRINASGPNIATPPKYFDNVQTSRLGQIYHARLRLECSSLNQHLFTKNLINSPLCSCGSIETPSHFLLSCSNYRVLRQRYLLTLPHPLSVQTLLNGIPEAPNEVNDNIFKHVQLFILASKRFKQ